MFEGAGAKALKVIDVKNIANIAAGDTITLNGVTFKMVQDAGLVKGENDIPIGATPELTVGSIVTAIRSHSSEALRAYDLTARNKQVMITQRSASTSDIPLILNSPAVGFVDSSNPSVYSFELWTAVSVGDSVTVADKQFIYGVGANTDKITYVSPGGNFADSVANLRTAILADNDIVELMNQGLITSVETNTYGVLSIQSKLSKEILGYGVDFSRTIVSTRLVRLNAVVGDIAFGVGGVPPRVVNPAVVAAATAAINALPSSDAATIQAAVQLAIAGAVGYVAGDNVIATNQLTEMDPINTVSSATSYARNLRFTALPVADDSVALAGQTFRFAPTTPLAPNEVAVGIGTASGSIINLYRAILADPTTAALIAADTLSVYCDNAGLLTVKSDANLGLAVNGTLAAIVPSVVTTQPVSNADVFAIKPAINVSSIRNIEGFIGTPVSSVKVIAQAHSGTVAGDGLAGKLYSQVTGGLPLPTPSADGDNVAVVEVDIAGRTFRSVVWQANGANLDNRVLVFTESSTSETFTVNTKTLGADISTLALASDTLAEPLGRLFSSTEFSQIRDLAVDTSGEKIIDGSGSVIGNVEGMTVSLDSTDFANKQFEDFTVIADPSGNGNVIFTATISGKELVTRLKVDELKEGAILKLNNPENGDVLVINIGKGGLESLSEPKNYDYIAYAMKKVLMKIGSGLDVRVGFDSESVSKVVIRDISATKLYRDNQNNYVSELTLLTKEGVRVAQEVITNALDYVRAAQASLQGQGEGVSKAATSLSSATGITKDASVGYLDTDLVEAASAFAASLKSILAAVSTLQSGAKVSDAGLEIIKSAAVA